MGKIRRRFDAQFKNQVCQAISSGTRSMAEICMDHQLSRSVVDRWMNSSTVGPIQSRPSNRERELERENEKLKAKVGELTMTVDILKKMDAWKRQQRSAALSVVTASNLAQFQKPAVPLASPSPAITTGRKSTRR